MFCFSWDGRASLQRICTSPNKAPVELSAGWLSADLYLRDIFRVVLPSFGGTKGWGKNRQVVEAWFEQGLPPMPKEIIKWYASGASSTETGGGIRQVFVLPTGAKVGAGQQHQKVIEGTGWFPKFWDVNCKVCPAAGWKPRPRSRKYPNLTLVKEGAKKLPRVFARTWSLNFLLLVVLFSFFFAFALPFRFPLPCFPFARAPGRQRIPPAPPAT